MGAPPGIASIHIGGIYPPLPPSPLIPYSLLPTLRCVCLCVCIQNHVRGESHPDRGPERPRCLYRIEDVVMRVATRGAWYRSPGYRPLNRIYDHGLNTNEMNLEWTNE